MRTGSLVVVDASVVVDALASDDQVGERARTLLADLQWAAPEHLRVEVFSGIRGRLLGDKLDHGRAERAVGRLERLNVQPVPTSLLLGRMWQLRDTVTGYDAAYVAAAERLDVPLVTTDRRLERATGIRCPIHVP
ncbi:MAG: type II toxin-antitoxin system VapC family toxin [Angustibacter sp.]